MIVEAIIDAGPGVVWPESRPQVRCPSSQVAPEPGEFGRNPSQRHGVRRINDRQWSGT